MKHTPTRAVPRSNNGRRMPRPSINTRASPSRANGRTARSSSPAGSPATSQAAPSISDSSSSLTATRSPRWRLFHNAAPSDERRPSHVRSLRYARRSGKPAGGAQDRRAARTDRARWWVRVKVSHAGLNRHDLFTLQGISGHPEGIKFPMILGNDAAGTLDDGTPVVIYPLMGSDDWAWRRDARSRLAHS